MTKENPPYGLATWLGIGAAAVQYVTALVILLVGGPVEASIGALGTATVALVGVLTGRYVQANTQIKANAVEATVTDDSSGEADDPIVEPPTEEDLAQEFPGDHPADLSAPVPETSTSKAGEA